MKTCLKKFFAVFFALMILLSCSFSAYAAQGDDQEEQTQDDTKPFLALGAEQTQGERAKALELLGISEDELDDYNVLYVTNKDEHTYLGDYMSESLIGTRALSCVLIKKLPGGSGISVSCTNINYCTPGMYRNALITAGVTDAEVEVVAPFSLPGTAALVGAMKSYEAMTGEAISEESKDAATDELITTGEIGKSIGDSQKAEELIALVKKQIVENGLNDPEKIKNEINKAAESLEIKLSDADRQAISNLMAKISNLDLNVDSIKAQAKDLYNKLSEIKIDQGVWDAIVQWFKNIWDAIVNFFKNLF